MDNNQFLLETLNRNTRILLECGDNMKFMKLAIDMLYKIYSQITRVTLDQLTHNKDVMLPSGKAVSTVAAAHRLFEMKRTAVFLRGINKAISLKLSESPTQPIRILYVDPGPYGTLLVPLLPLYQSTELKVDFLDINRTSLVALLGLTGSLNLESYIDEVYCTDATTFRITKPYDIVICQTMHTCLKSEPQVAIMLNLIPQLDDDSIFIPQEISIDASLTNPKMEIEKLQHHENERPPFARHSLGNLFTLSKLDLDSILSYKTLLIPHVIDTFPVLKLFTTVKVFDKEVLTENDSSITLPMEYYDFRNEPARELEFWYVLGEKPRIESYIVRPELLQKAVELEYQQN